MVECADLTLLAADAFAYDRPQRDPPSHPQAWLAELVQYGRAPDPATLRASFLELEELVSRAPAGRGTKRCYGAGDVEMATSSLHLTDGGAAMPQPNDLSRSLVALACFSTGRDPTHKLVQGVELLY